MRTTEWPAVPMDCSDPGTAPKIRIKPARLIKAGHRKLQRLLMKLKKNEPLQKLMAECI